MNLVLDTDILIYFLKGKTSVVNSLTNASPDMINTTIINQAELFFGAFNSEFTKKNLDVIERFLKTMTILPFCTEASRIFGEQKALLKKNGKMIADMDLMIGSICIANQATLITNNEKHFKRLKLNIENWV